MAILFRDTHLPVNEMLRAAVPVMEKVEAGLGIAPEN